MDNLSLFKEYENVFAEGEAVEETKKDGPIYLYSPFALQDAIGARDVKNIWIEYNKLIFQGVEPEELIHKIVSKVRDMCAIGRGASKEDLGIKSDFPYNKSKKDFKNWKMEDLENFYTKLVSIYHESRMGGEELKIALERALLTI